MVLNQDKSRFLGRQVAFFPQLYTSTSASQQKEHSTSSNSNSNSSPTLPTATVTSQHDIDSVQFLQNFYDQLFPIILSNWVEITSTLAENSKTNEKSEELPYLEALDTLSQILGVILGILD